MAQTSLNYRSRLLPTRTQPLQVANGNICSKKPVFGFLRTYPNIISHEIAENTNKPLIKELKDYVSCLALQLLSTCQRPGA